MAADDAPDPALVKEEAARFAAEFDARSTEVREYYQAFFGQQLRETLQGLASERPADATLAMAQVFKGKKSIGDLSKEAKTKDPALKSAAPRQYLHQSVAPDLVPELVRCFNEKPRRPVSDLGAMLEKRVAAKK